MAAPICAAAAVGFIGSQATAFVVQTPGAAKPSALRGATRASGAAWAAPQLGVVSAPSALCTGSLAGLVAGGAVAATKRRACKAVNLPPRQSEGKPFDPTKAVGAMDPTGYWDPCGVMKERVGKDGWKWRDEATFKYYRAAELKHGRICMMAATGMITCSLFHFPGFESVPDGWAALQTPEGGAGFGILFIIAAGFEINYPDGDYANYVDYTQSEASWFAPSFKKVDPNTFKNKNGDAWGVAQENVYGDDMMNRELANGRVAMSAVLTFFLYDLGAKLSPTALLGQTNYAIYAGAFLILIMMVNNPEGVAKGEYVPSMLSYGNPTVIEPPKLPESSTKETKQIDAKIPATA